MDNIQIREVWNDNLEDEFALIHEIIDQYPYIAMDTEYPGAFTYNIWDANDQSSNDSSYKILKSNVDHLKLIQLGLTFSDVEGNLPTCGTDKFCVWQFNFREFNPQKDEHVVESIQLLRESGIDFAKNNEKGVDISRFAQLLVPSGIVMNEDVHWVTFHGMYDFGYLLKLVTGKSLPDTEEGFLDWIKMYCPVFYDIKHLIKFCDGLHAGLGLKRVAETLRVQRVGIPHQAGSDSLLTSAVYVQLKRVHFNVQSPRNYAGVLFGL